MLIVTYGGRDTKTVVDVQGCIPVIVVDGYVLPFSEVLDWSRASIRVHPHDVHKLFDILERISDEQETELREQVSNMHTYKIYYKMLIEQ